MPILMRITSRHKTQLDRQVEEAMRIEIRGRADPNSDLNEKSKWRRSRVPKLMVFI